MKAQPAVDDKSLLRVFTPLWLQSNGALPGALTIVTSDELRYSMVLFDGWTAEPEVLPSAMQIDHVYHGPAPVDWLVASLMPRAVPGHNMLNWVDIPVRKFGFPSIQLVLHAKPSPELLAWNYEGNSPQFIAKLGLKEMHGFTGLARIGDGIARIYVVILRKATLAWMFFLSLQSAAGDGNELATLRDDHRHAGTVFGSLRLNLPAKLPTPRSSPRRLSQRAR